MSNSRTIMEDKTVIAVMHQQTQILDSPTLPKPSSLLPFNLKKCLSSNDILTPPQSPLVHPILSHQNNVRSPLPNPKFNLEQIDEQEHEKSNNRSSNTPTPSCVSTSSSTSATHTPSSPSHPPLVASISCGSIRHNNNSNKNKKSTTTTTTISNKQSEISSDEDDDDDDDDLDEEDDESSSTEGLHSSTTAFSTSTSSNFSLSSVSSNTNDFSPLKFSNPNCQSLLAAATTGITTASCMSSPSSTVLLRVKLPASHPLITKVLRFPLCLTIKETLDRIHECVHLDNRINLIIIHKQSILPHQHLLSNYFVNDDGILPMIEIKEVTSMSSSTSILGNSNNSNNSNSSRPKLLKTTSVQNLLNSMPNPYAKAKRSSNGKENLLFQPPPPSYTLELEKLMWITGDHSKSIPCIHHKWHSSEGKPSKLTIIYSGCDREDLGMIRKNIRILSDILQCNLICYDYTGFGLNSSGKPTMKELLGDISIVYNYCIKVLNIPSSNIILMGKSIGTICSLKFAGELFPKPNKNGSVNNSSNNNSNSNKNINVTPRKEESIYAEMPLGGLILVSSFGPSGLSENIVNRFLSLDSLDHLKYVNRIACPVMLVHGIEDDIVDVKSAKKLSKQFQKLYRYMPIKDASHWNLDSTYLDDYADEMIEFVQSLAPDQFNNRKERELPRSYAMSPSKVVGAWLDRLELSEYTNVFLQAGYFEMMAIASLDRNMLELLGVDEPHIPLLLEEISKISVRYSSGSSSSTISEMPSELCAHFVVSSSGSITSSSTADSSGVVNCHCESGELCDCSSSNNIYSNVNANNNTNSNNNNNIKTNDNNNLMIST